MIKGIIFDLDGTLCDTVDDIRTAMNAALLRLGYRIRSRADILKYINGGAAELVKKSLPRDVQNVDFIVRSATEMFETEYAKCYCEKTKAYDGIAKMLMDLKGMGYKIGVLSNKRDLFVKDIVDKLFDKKLFNYVMGRTNLPLKPAPASALYVAKQMGVKPQRCALVGDSDIDVITAANANMQIIGVSWGYRPADILRQAGAVLIADSADRVTELVKTFDEG